MPNFNSREVAEIIWKKLMVHFADRNWHLQEGFCKQLFQSEVDSALLAAHPEAGELAKNMREIGVGVFKKYDSENENCLEYLLSKIRNETDEQRSICLAAALESAKREERERCEKKRIADLEHWRDTAGTDEEVEILECLINIPKYKLDSLAEKEGGR